MRIRAVVALVVIALVAGYGLARAADQTVPAPLKETVNGITYHMPFGRPTRPFTPAVQGGNLIFLAGQIGTAANAQGPVVAGGIQAETKQTMDNIKEVLEKSGSDLDHVVKCSVFMADMKEWDAMNAIYATYFPNHKPARSALGTNGLALGARVEIECIAIPKLGSWAVRQLGS